MCFSILRIGFKNDKTKEYRECVDEADERAKIKEAREKDQTAKVEVFRCQRIIRREEVWNELPYTAPVVEEPRPRAVLAREPGELVEVAA